VFKSYVALTKPGIICGNAITAAGGVALASKGHIDYGLLLAVLLGLSCIVGSACVFNNYIDRKADRRMARTKNRPLAKGSISVKNALLFGTLLGLIGVLTLDRYTNLLTLLVALAGFFIYVGVYSFFKYRSEYGTLVGSIAGAVPPVVGYCAVTHHLDAGAAVLFLIVVFWQMPHFFAIALYRLNDYLAAAIPVLPLKKGVKATKKQMLFYIGCFMAAALALPLLGYAGYIYLAMAALLGSVWLWLCFKGFKADNDALWARTMFRFSLVVIMVLCFMISID
jgi:protoheme IX farnesyltransferase